MTDLNNNQYKKDQETIIWNEFNMPKSSYFDDIYFSNDDATAETKYVFIDGNKLAERFINHNKPTLTIGETGFGSGLSFLITWHTFQLFKQKNPNHILKKLLFCSVEKYPLSKKELCDIHQHIIKDSVLSRLAKQLQMQWNSRSFLFNDDVELNILFDDVIHFSRHLEKNQHYIDAWFFDGFSPQKNTDMWSSQLFSQLYQITKPQGTFATFSAAGMVRRNLITAGFNVEKRKGFGKKREMLIGYKN